MILPFLLSLSITSVNVFQDQQIFHDPIANPRSNQSSLCFSSSEYHGVRINYVDAAVGLTLPIATFKLDGITIQTGIQGNAWLTLGYIGNLVFPLLTEDYYFSFPLAVSYDPYVFVIKFNHISAHKGDGLDRLVEGTLSSNRKEDIKKAEEIAKLYGVGVSLREPIVYSRDFLSLLIMRSDFFGKAKVNNYINLGYAHKMYPDNLARYYFGLGTEVEYKVSEALTPFVAIDLTKNGDVGLWDKSVLIGNYLYNRSNNLFNIALIGNLYMGSDRRGQLVGRKITQFSIGFLVKEN